MPFVRSGWRCRVAQERPPDARASARSASRRHWWQQILTPTLSILAAFVVGAGFLLIEGFNPLTVYRELFEASFTSRFGITDSLTIAVPLILTGLAAAVVFRMNLFNIGAEGQLYLGAISGRGPDWPSPASSRRSSGSPSSWSPGRSEGAVGGPGGGVQGLLSARARSVTTLMLTFIALYLMQYLILAPIRLARSRDPTLPPGKKIPSSAGSSFGATPACTGVWSWRSRLALRLDADPLHLDLVRMNVCSSDAAALYAHPGPAHRPSWLADVRSAGRSGRRHRGGRRAYSLDPNGLELGLGFTGIVVAALARYNPFAIVLVATFLGGLRNAGDALQSLPCGVVPVEVSLMLQGVILCSRSRRDLLDPPVFLSPVDQTAHRRATA